MWCSLDCQAILHDLIHFRFTRQVYMTLAKPLNFYGCHVRVSVFVCSINEGYGIEDLLLLFSIVAQIPMVDWTPVTEVVDLIGVMVILSFLTLILIGI